MTKIEIKAEAPAFAEAAAGKEAKSKEGNRVQGAECTKCLILKQVIPIRIGGEGTRFK